MNTNCSVAAVFLFNHRFERNLDTLDRIYAERFPLRRYIMPFARSERHDVIRVRETSWHFSGHLAQAADKFIVPDVSHYIFISDDLIVNPKLSAANIVDQLGLVPGQGYIKSLASLDALRYSWFRSLEATIKLRRYGLGFDYRAELPAAEDAQAKFERLGIKFSKPRVRTRKEADFALRKLAKGAGYLSIPWAMRFRGKRSDYPLLGGYSDFLVVPADAIERFAHYCGVFAALDLFAEVAVPTALALACDDVLTELRPGEGFNQGSHHRRTGFAWTGMEFWKPEETPAFAARFDSRLERLLAEFPSDWLYVHPVKLSQWQ